MIFGNSKQLIAAYVDKIKELESNRFDGASQKIQSDTYVDVSGILGQPGESFNHSDLVNIWNINHEADPSMQSYDNMDQWIADTLSYMTETIEDDKEVSIYPHEYNVFYTDSSGCLGEVGEIYSLADIKQLWNDNYAYDFSMETFDSFDEWFEETRLNLTRDSLSSDNISDELSEVYGDLVEDNGDIYSSTAINANRDDNYFGEVAAFNYGDLILNHLGIGATISKRQDLAEEPGGLIYEANELGIDMWELLEALEGMCADGRVAEVDDSTYQIVSVERHPVRSLFYNELADPNSRWLSVDSSIKVEGDMTADEILSTSDTVYVNQLWEIADRYSVSQPVSGDWDTELEHELHAIMDEMGMTEQQALDAMIKYLGFEYSDFADAGIMSSTYSDRSSTAQGAIDASGDEQDWLVDNPEEEEYGKYGLVHGNRLACPYCTQPTDKSIIDKYGMCWDCYDNNVE